MMCSQHMWRRVKSWSQPIKPRQRPAAARLGDWAATTFTENGDDLVIAMEVQTYLTVVFPFGERAVFDGGFSRALSGALEDLGVMPDASAIELSAAPPVCRYRIHDPRIREALDFAEFTCAVERGYGHDLRTAQRHLNDLPHNLPPDYVAAKAVRRLFRTDAAGRN